MRFLTCEPNLTKKENYVDVADRFYADPAAWIRAHIPVYPPTALPTHVVLFDTLTDEVSEFLSKYKQIHSIYHAVRLIFKSVFANINPVFCMFFLQYIFERIGNFVSVFQRLTQKEIDDAAKLYGTSVVHDIPGEGVSDQLF